jgi:hypothetical protein
MSSTKDQEILDMLMEHIAYERNQDQQVIQQAVSKANASNSSSSSSASVSSALSAVSSSASILLSDVFVESFSTSPMTTQAVDIIHLYARGMTLFDKNVHMVRHLFSHVLPYLDF